MNLVNKTAWGGGGMCLVTVGCKDEGLQGAGWCEGGVTGVDQSGCRVALPSHRQDARHFDVVRTGVMLDTCTPDVATTIGFWEYVPTVITKPKQSC